MVRILIREGQNMDEQSQEMKNSPLHLAAQSGHFLIVRLLVDLGADRQLLNKQGKTCLVLAEESLDKELAKLGGPKKRAKAGPPAKGSLLDRLQATVDFLYEKDGRNRDEEKAAAASAKK